MDPNNQDSSNPQQPNDNQNTVAGYDPKDILKAPLATPEPAATEPPEMTSNTKVKSLMTVAIVLFVIGLATMLINIRFALLIMLIAAIVAATTVFAPIK